MNVVLLSFPDPVGRLCARRRGVIYQRDTA